MENKDSSIINSLRSFFNLNGANNDSNNADEYARNSADDYAVVRSKKFYIVSIVVSFFAAVFIWLVSVTNGTAVGEQMYNVSLDMKEYSSFVSAAEQNGFNVVAETNTTVSFILEGRKKSISRVTMEDISVYIDLGKYIEELDRMPNNTEQTIVAEIVIEAPIYFSISDVSKKEITIKLIPINKITN